MYLSAPSEIEFTAVLNGTPVLRNPLRLPKVADEFSNLTVVNGQMFLSKKLRTGPVKFFLR